MSSDPYTLAFQRASLTLRLPRLSIERAIPPRPDATTEEALMWAEGLIVEERSGAFYDEKLLCVCELSIPAPPTDTPSFTYTEFEHLCRSSQITASCAFLTQSASHQIDPQSYPSASASSSRPPPGPSRRTSTIPLARSESYSRSNSTTIPTLSVSTGGNIPPVRSNTNALPPKTPNPMPSTRNEDEVYAMSEGRIVWEGSLRGLQSLNGTEPDSDLPIILSTPISDYHDSGIDPGDPTSTKGQGTGKAKGTKWRAIWIGYLPLSFADLAPPNEEVGILGVTGTITLRSEDLGRDKGNISGSTDDPSEEDPQSAPHPQSKISAGSLRTTDLLQGLGGSDALPSSRFKHVQDVMHPLVGSGKGRTNNSGSGSVTTSARSSLIARHAGAGGLIKGIPGQGQGHESSTEMAAVMRKSFKTVLPVLSALQIRMRTLPSIMVDTTLAEHNHEEGGRGGDDMDELLSQGQGEDRGRTLICVEAELGSGMDQLGVEYELVDLEVVVAGRRKAGSLWASSDGARDSSQFPLTIGKGEQHNFVFKIDPPGNANWANGGQEQGQENIRIAIKGRVVERSGSGSSSGKVGRSPSPTMFKTDQFTAIWNSVVDMRALAIPPKTARFDYAESETTEHGSTGLKSAALTTGMRSVHAGGQVPSAATTERTRGGGRAGPRGTYDVDGFGFDRGEGGDLVRDLIMSATIVPMSEEEREREREQETGSDAHDGQKGDGEKRGTNDVKTFQPFMLEVIFLNLAEEVLKLMVSVCFDQGGSSGHSPTIIPLEESTTLTPLQPRACQAIRLRCMAIGLGVLDVPPIEIHDLGRGMSCRAVLGMKVRAS